MNILLKFIGLMLSRYEVFPSFSFFYRNFDGLQSVSRCHPLPPILEHVIFKFSRKGRPPAPPPPPPPPTPGDKR